MNALKQGRIMAMVEVVQRYNGIRAGHAGHELWGTHRTCRPENVINTAWARPAGKLLARAESMGLVRHEQHGPAKLWYANSLLDRNDHPNTEGSGK
jgi:hypothetical protein